MVVLVGSTEWVQVVLGKPFFKNETAPSSSPQ